MMSVYALSLFAMGALALIWHGISAAITLDAARVAAPGGRIGVAAAALLPCCAVLAAMIAGQMALRFRSRAFDPLAGRDGRALLLTQRVITNTLEQMALFVPALLALAAGAPPQAMPRIAAAGPAFALARLLFWAGYARHPLLRAPGMASTFAIGCATIAAAGYIWLA